MESVDVSYYLGETSESIKNLDVPLSNGQIVSINLVEELPEDPIELVTFLKGENCGKKYWITIARAYAQLNKLDEAQSIVTNALELSHFNSDDITNFQSFLVWLYFKYIANGIDRENYLIKANAKITQLNENSNISNTSTNTSNVLSKAILFMLNGKYDLALDIFEKLLKIDNNNCFALLGKAQIVLHKSKNYSFALKLYQQVLILNPLMKPDPRNGIGICAWFLKDHKMATQAWERSLELDPNNLKAKILLNLAKFNSTFTNSLTDDEFLQNYKLCLNDLTLNYKESPNDFVIKLVLISYLFSQEKYDVIEKLISKMVFQITGEDLLKFNNFSKLSKFKSNILSQLSTWLGRISFVSSNFTDSSKYFQTAIKLNDANLIAKLGLGQSQFNRGSTEEAIMSFESILKSNLKCLEVNYSLGILYSQQKSKRKQEQAIQILERYIKLSNNRGLSSGDNDGYEFLNKEPIILNAFLVLSKLYESKDINQSLTYLNKAIESRSQISKDVPLEVYNNIGVFNFMKQNFEEAASNFETAKKLDEGVQDDLCKDLLITLNFNLARAKEFTSKSESIEIYEQLLMECPNYFSAKLRLLFLDCISSKVVKADIKNEIDHLLTVSSSNMEIRSFYGWFVKNFGKKLGLKPDADTNHQKETLVDYDSHDCYALISLANIYCIMARDNKDDKKKKYYIRATELFTKVLSVDPKNVYAAQGLAITFIENKELDKGLDILRKIRDSLNDISIYLNLGHVLADLKQYGKAIENYEIASSRFTDGKDSKIMSFLGRAWYLRANGEKNFDYYNKSIEYIQKSLEFATGSHSSLKFNLAYVQFQVAEFISKTESSQRVVEDIDRAIVDLHSAIESLNELASEEEQYPPYPKSDLKARANLGTALLNRLNLALKETSETNEKIAVKLEEAMKLRDEEQAAVSKIKEEELEKMKIKEEQMAKERAILQEQAQLWAEESRMNVIVDDDDMNDVDEETTEKKKKQKSKAKKRKGKKNIIEETDEEPEEPDEPEESDNEPEPQPKKNGKRKGSALDEDDEEEEVSSRKKKSKKLSKEFIQDSDDDLDDDLFDEEKEEVKEKVEVEGEGEEEGKKVDEEKEEDPKKEDPKEEKNDDDEE